MRLKSLIKHLEKFYDKYGDTNVILREGRYPIRHVEVRKIIQTYDDRGNVGAILLE